jgi:hypothetical protein
VSNNVLVGAVQVSTGPTMTERGMRPIFNEQGAPIGSHSFSRSAAGSQSPVVSQGTRPIFNEGGMPIGSQSFSHSAAHSASEGFTSDQIGSGPTGPTAAGPIAAGPIAAGPITAAYDRTGHTGAQWLESMLACTVLAALYVVTDSRQALLLLFRESYP